MAYCLYDGKVDQGSEFETNLYQSLFQQLKEIEEWFILQWNATKSGLDLEGLS